MMDMLRGQELIDQERVSNLDRAIAALKAAQRSQTNDKYGIGLRRPAGIPASTSSPMFDQDLINTLNSPRVELQPRENFPRNPLAPDGWWDHTNKFFERRDAETEARNIATDVARGFSPTTQMPSGGGTSSSPSRPTGPRGGGAGGRKTRPPAPRSEGEPFGGANLGTVLSALALSPYQEERRVVDRVRRPDPSYGPMDGPISRAVQELAGLFGFGPQAPQYDYMTEPVFRSPMAEIAYNSYNPYGVLFSDPVMTDTYPYYSARPEMIPTMYPNNTRGGTWRGY